MKKNIALFLAVIFFVLSFSACSNEKNEVDMGNGVDNSVSVSSADEILERFGVNMLPKQDYLNVGYSIITNESSDVAQMEFILNRRDFCYRAKVSSQLEDISGVDAKWDNTVESSVGGCPAIVKWNDDAAGVILWHNGSITFSLGMGSGAFENELVSVANSLFSNGESDTVIEISEKLPYSMDLDGDGTVESVFFESLETADNSDILNTAICVEESDGSVCRIELGELSDMQTWISDIDGDGFNEVFVSGVIAPDFNRTYCFVYDGQLRTVAPEYDKYEFLQGRIVNFGTGSFTVSSKINLLGMYDAECTYTVENRSVIRANGSIWLMRDNNCWLEVAMDLPANSTCGEDVMIKKGTTLRFTAFDGVNMLWFEDSTGQEGFITLISEDDKQGWTIDGIDACKYFIDADYSE